MTLQRTKTPQNIIQWDNNDRPYSQLYDDHYYSEHNGFRESQHVFIEGNNLPSRWNKLHSKQCFTIMETGFGTGLNFLSSLLLWQSTQDDKDTQLHYISIEAYPLSAEQLKRSLVVWQQQLSEQITLLLQHYPSKPAFNSSYQHLGNIIEIEFKQIRVKLSLIVETLENSFNSELPDYSNQVDAWFLDGFSPAKNPEMWTDELFNAMAQYSKDNATVATYTVAGLVRRGLASVGFNVQRKSGFGTKRDMLYAEFN